MEVKNIAIIVDLRMSPLDLNKIHDNVKGTEFTSLASRWLKMKLPPENVYVAFYRSGKFSVTGIHNFKDIEKIVNRVLEILKKIEINVNEVKIKINTMTCIDKIQLNHNLDSIFPHLDPYKASYELEQFPGLIYKDWDTAFILFNSGKIVIVGSKSMEMAETSLKKFKKVINNI